VTRSLITRAVDRTASLLRRVVPAPIWNQIAEPYRDWRFARQSRRAWLDRRDDVDGHVAMYWGSIEHPNRRKLVEVLASVIDGLDMPRPRVLEFGCHAGMNFHLLHERFAQVELYGVEPNHDAVAFARTKVPYVRMYEADDGAFVKSTFPLQTHMDVSFVNVVLYAMSSARAKAVVQRLCASSDVIVLGEQLANTTTSSQLQQEPTMYVHPYASWLRANGFSKQEVVPAPEPQPQLSGFLIARR
jgi:trans-aconitate methyltransferase